MAGASLWAGMVCFHGGVGSRAGEMAFVGMVAGGVYTGALIWAPSDGLRDTGGWGAGGGPGN